MAHRLFVLVDYDNLSNFLNGRTLEAVVRHIESKIPDAFLEHKTRVEVRLYGGWVTGSQLTPAAQRLTGELQAKFPTTFSRLDKSGTVVTRHLACSFARSSLSLPNEDLRDTFVTGRSVRNVYIDQGAWRPCAAPANCHLKSVESFIDTTQCGNAACSVSSRDLLKRNEQKQVDTLIVADMAELAFRLGATSLVVVSSDADMWPGVLLCLSAGSSVCHVHTTPGGRTKPNLTVNLARVRTTYTEVSV